MTDTKERILDTAERLFAKQGYAATSLRGIIAEAGVNLAAVHYHFHSKEALLEAVILRRSVPANRERLALLDRFEKEREGNPPSFCRSTSRLRRVSSGWRPRWHNGRSRSWPAAESFALTRGMSSPRLNCIGLRRSSFWDALIVHAARSAGAVVLYTEDLQPGAVLGGVRVVNPFLA